MVRSRSTRESRGRKVSDMRALKDWAGIKLVLAATLVVGAVGMAPAGARAVDQTDSVTPLRHTSCHHADSNRTSPCLQGNVYVICSYLYNSCDYDPYMHCKLSAELGEHQLHMEGQIETSTLVHPHKTVSCHGTARLLAVYRVVGIHVPYVYTPVHLSSRRNLFLTLYGREGAAYQKAENLAVMAQS
jgi:hypothetical protein